MTHPWYPSSFEWFSWGWSNFFFFFEKKCKMAVFQNRQFSKFSQTIFFLPHENQPKLLGYQGWVEILMITLVYSKRVSVRNNLLHSVSRPMLLRQISWLQWGSQSQISFEASKNPFQVKHKIYEKVHTCLTSSINVSIQAH